MRVSMRRASMALEIDQHAGNTRKANKREIDPEDGLNEEV
jgi:hypothetical protein